MMLDMEHKIYLSRGKRLDNKQWVYGAVLFHDGNAATIFNQHPGDGSLQGFEVDIETVCRCTGITDMNNNLIWEMILSKTGTAVDASHFGIKLFGITKKECGQRNLVPTQCMALAT